MGTKRSTTGGQSRFASIPSANIQRSSFDRSNGLKTTLNAGQLVPIFVDEALPGDTFNLKSHLFGRLATPINPVMENLWLDVHYFAVPNRLVWDNWQKFNGEQDNPGDSTDYLVPQVSTGVGATASSLYDYMGIPLFVDNLNVNALPFRAYNLIWNEWFRDENLQTSVTVPRDDGPDVTGDYSVLPRGKRHDYFTSCLPWPQKGEAVNIPLLGQAPLAGSGDVITQGTGIPTWDAGPDTGVRLQRTDQAIQNAQYVGGSATPGQFDEPKWNEPSLALDLTATWTDLSQATAATINDLREAFQLQRIYERDARGGSRYTEIIRSHFGVVSPDARLQRPEYLGGSTNAIMINPVAQQSETDTGTPQGNLAAFGTVNGTGRGFTKSFTEHCIIIGVASVRADLNYQEGVNRMWSRRTRFDFYWPSLAHLGEQAVLNKEIFADGTTADDNVFGYQERYAEYRYKPSMITGMMRSIVATSLDSWHLAQQFSTLPALNADFIKENPPIDRIIAVQDEPHLLLDCYFQLRCARPMPTYSVPGLIDHF